MLLLLGVLLVVPVLVLLLSMLGLSLIVSVSSGFFAVLAPVRGVEMREGCQVAI